MRYSLDCVLDRAMEGGGCWVVVAAVVIVEGCHQHARIHLGSSDRSAVNLIILFLTYNELSLF